jgi:hypothetical protein
MSPVASSFYLEEISALQNYQKEILKALDDLTKANQSLTGTVALTAIDAVTGALGAGGANNGLGTFPEAQQLSTTYNSVMKTLLTNFEEISKLVNAMANALGSSAKSYQETEQQITDSFTKIVTQYESQTGGFSTTPKSTAAATTSGQPGTGSSYNSATPSNSSGTTTQTSNYAATTTPSNSISTGNQANTSNDASSEE